MSGIKLAKTAATVTVTSQMPGKITLKLVLLQLAYFCFCSANITVNGMYVMISHNTAINARLTSAYIFANINVIFMVNENLYKMVLFLTGGARPHTLMSV